MCHILCSRDRTNNDRALGCCTQGIVCSNLGENLVTSDIDRETRDLDLDFGGKSGDLNFPVFETGQSPDILGSSSQVCAAKQSLTSKA